MLSYRAEDRVPMIEMLMLRRLLEIPQEPLLNPLFVRSMATTILVVECRLLGRRLIGTLWLPLRIEIELLGRTAMMTVL